MEPGHTFLAGPLPLVVHVVVVVVQTSVGQLVKVLEKVVLVEQVMGLVEVVQEEVDLQEVVQEVVVVHVV